MFLSGCHSADLGRSIHDRGVPFVVCWKTMVHDEAAYLFTRGFFQSLGEQGVASDGKFKYDYKAAFAAGRAAVEAKMRPSRDGSRVPYFFLGDPDQEKKRGNRWAAGLPKLFAPGVS